MLVSSRSNCMRKRQVFLLIILSICCYQSTFGQRCGAGNATFYVSDDNEMQEVENFKISFHTVSEDQNWQYKNADKFGWKLQTFDEKLLDQFFDSKKITQKLAYAYEISYAEYSRLLSQRTQIIKDKPDSFVAKNIERCNIYRRNTPPDLEDLFTLCVTEGCNKMVVAEVSADGYETAYYLDNFTCGCSKTYRLKLKRKRNRCLPK